MKNNKSVKIIFTILLIVLLIALGYIILMKKPVSTEQLQTNSSSITQSATTSSDQQSTSQTSQGLIQCGSINQKILTQPTYQPTESEKQTAILSLTCINQAIIKCSPASLTIQDTNESLNVSVEGEGKLGCNISVPKSTGQKIICPLPSEYINELQQKFTIKNYDASILTGLIGDMNAEIDSGNKSGACMIEQ